MPSVETIDDVIARMDALLDRAVAQDDPRGYFTCVYRAVTARVRDGILAGEFEDNDRMHDFDVRFARFYLDAYDAHERRDRCSTSWQRALDAASGKHLVLQHVLVGMNAHINLDLGVAAAATAPGASINDLHADFQRLNDVLAAMVDRMQAAIARVSPWTGMVDRVGGRFDEALTDWSIGYARHRAWEFATALAVADEQQHELLVTRRDAGVARLTDAMLSPGMPLRGVVGVARLLERRATVRTVTEELRTVTP